jgi:hypothetical protein
LTIIILGTAILFRGVKEKIEFNKIVGQVIFLDKKYKDLPNRDFEKYRYLKIDSYSQVFEIFIGKDFGDFKPEFENIDKIQLGDKIEIFFDKDGKENEEEISRLIQYIDINNIPYYKRGSKDKIGGIILTSIGIALLLTISILKRTDKIE